MKKIFFPAAVAIALAFSATDASAQQTIGQGTSSDRPMPTNSEITESQSQEKRMTNGKPMEQIRANETDSPRNRNQPQQDIQKTTRNKKATPATAPAERRRAERPIAPTPAPAR